MIRLPLTIAVAIALAQIAPPTTGDAIAERVVKLTRDSTWTPVRSVALSFRTFHPQGMVKIGDTLFVSSVEVRVPTKRGRQPDARLDRDTGEGVGHLFKIDMSGKLLADVRSAKARCTTLAASTTTARTSGCRWPSTVPTADRSSTASIPRR